MLFDPGPSDKKCFVYCGDEECDCAASPRYRLPDDFVFPPLVDDFSLPVSETDTEKTG